MVVDADGDTAMVGITTTGTNDAATIDTSGFFIFA